VKPQAFEPDRDDTGISTFRTEDLGDGETWALGRGLRAHQTLKARADLPASVYSDEGLTVDPDNDPPLHVYITGWPGWPTDPVASLAVRTRLAKAARFVQAPA
jgi:hypothetical protein